MDSLRRLFIVALGVLVLFGFGDTRTAEPGAAPTATEGQSVTHLSDGRWLLMGGRSGNAVSASIVVRSATPTGESSTQTAQLAHARYGHSATVLPDGTVFVFGGIGADGALVRSAEVIDPLSGETTVIDDAHLTSRTRHSATLLTDGRVLISGGIAANGATLQSAQLWNADTQTVESIPNLMSAARSDHHSELLSNGLLLMSKGRNAAGELLTDAELFDPDAATFHPVNADDMVGASALANAQVAASLPTANATGVSVSDRIVVRFNQPLLVDSINDQALVMVGPAGAVSGKVVAADDGMLAFFKPNADLLPNATYTLFLKGVKDLPFTALSFTTASITDEPASQSITAAPKESSREAGVSSATQTKTPARSLEAKKAVPSQKPAARKKDQPKEQEPLTDDEFEDWLPGPQHRHGHWRVLGSKNEPRVRGLLEATPLLKAEANVTALSGRVARLNGRPIEGVAVSIGSVTTQTDQRGRFLLTNVPGGSQVLAVDGSRAMSKGRHYTSHFIHVEVAAKRATQIAQPIYLARVNPANDVTFPSPTDREIVLTNSAMPGLELHIAKGVVLRTPDGKIVTRLNLTPLPVDRVPFAVPAGFPVYFTVQPAGVFVDGSSAVGAGIRIVYPNYLDAAPGTRVAFYNYDPSGAGWQIYGYGTVSSDGKQVLPDEGVVQHDLMGFGEGLENNGNAPGTGPPPGGCAEAGDPVDCATGLFLHRVRDLEIEDIIPISLIRTYRPNDSISRDFGIGATHNFSLFINNPTSNVTIAPSSVEVILPDGGRLVFNRISGGGFGDSVYRHTDSPTSFNRAVLRFNSTVDRWQMTLRDQTVYEFSDHAPNTLLAIRDRYGNAVTIARQGTGGNISRVTSPNGRYFDFVYDTLKRITQITDNIGRTVRYEYDSQGRLKTVTDPDNKVEQYNYDSSHRMTSVIDKRGNTMVTNVYDENGRVGQQTLANGAIWRFAYTVDLNGNVTQTDITNPRGFLSQLSFNSARYVTRIAHAVGQPEEQTTLIERESNTNLISKITDALNRVTAFTYDDMGNTTSTTYLAGTANAVTESATFERRFGNQTSFTDALNHLTQLSYDESGNLSGITDPLGHRISATYDAMGQVLTATDPLGRTSTATYDLADVALVTDPLGRSVSLLTDGLGRVTGASDPSGNLSRFVYDTKDRVTQGIDALGGTTTVTYDENDNVRTVRDARSLADQVFTYDISNRIRTWTDALGASETYEYDGMDNLKSVVDRKNQTTTTTFDALDRPKKTTFADGNSVTFIWDAGDRVRQLIDTANGTMSFEYDGLDRLTHVTSPQGEVSYEYDAAGRRKKLTIPGQAPIQYEYDDANRLTKVFRGSAETSFTYDDGDFPSTVTLPNGIVGTYDFDDAGELRSLVYEKGATRIGEVAYTYDETGLRTGTSGSLAAMHLPRSVAGATYNAANRLTAWGDSALTYDANGNLRTFNGATYNWDAREQLIGTSNGNGSFTYDPLGRRSSRTVAGDTTHYLYDGWNPLKVDDDVMLTGPALDEIYARISPTGITSFVRDDLGNTRLLTNASGATTAGYSYAPYGDSSKTGDDDTSFQFTGRENDGATKLDYYRERYYSTELERFISEDPVGLEGGINAYAYADGDPISLTDPMGLFTTVDAYCSRHGDDCLDILGEILGNLGHLSGDKCLEAQLNDTARIFSKVSKGVKLLKGIRPRGRRDGHHPYPKYLGGKEMQNLEKLKPHLHREYHRGLDRIAPRWLNRYYYEAYPADAKRRLHEEIREYTREFDRKHGTSILNSMFKNGFPRR